MLRDLTKRDWQKMLGLSNDQTPQALMLRGTRNLRHQYDRHRRHFDDVIEVCLPNGIIEDVFIGRFSGHLVAYASVYGAPMASEIVHLFGVLGTSLVIQTGCCGGLADNIVAGDVVLTTEAFCGEGAAQYYQRRRMTVRPTLNPSSFVSMAAKVGVPVHLARMFTTSALFAEGEEEVEQWFTAGWAAVDMETATTLAVAEHFGMESLAVHFVFDNPRRKEHLLLSQPEKDQRRAAGEAAMIQMTLDIMRDYLQEPRNWRRGSDSVALSRRGDKEHVTMNVTGMDAPRPSSGSTMRYRNATAADAPVLAQMNHQLIRDEGHRNRMSVSDLEQRMRSWLDGEYQAVLFEDEQGAAGYALYKREAEWVYVRQFFIQPERRRQGVGRAAWAWLRENRWREAPRIRLEVLIGNASGIQFWRSLGFEDYCITMERANEP